MTASQIGYDKLLQWVKRYLAEIHFTALSTIAWMVLCLLLAQRLNPAALARALPAEQAGSGRSRLRRVQRWRQGPLLPTDPLTQRLIQAALPLLPAGQTVIVALDTTRIGAWEVWQAGVVFAGHTLPIAWDAVPYPWPRGHFRQTTLSLIRRIQAAFPAGWHWVLVADRGFPSAALFAQLLAGRTGWTVRLRLSDWVEVEGVRAQVVNHLVAGRLVAGGRVRATVGRGTADQPQTTAWLVVNDVIPPLPKHKRNGSSERERAMRRRAAQAHLCSKGRKSSPPSETARRYAQTWVLFTTAGSVDAAVSQYAARMAIEQGFRDWHHGWGVRGALGGESSEVAVKRMVGVVVLAYRLQVELGWRLSQDPVARRRRAQWTATNRVSFFWCGQQLFRDAGYSWAGWLCQQWAYLTDPTCCQPTIPAA